MGQCLRQAKSAPEKWHYHKNILNLFVDFFENSRIIWFCMDMKMKSKIPQYGTLPALSRMRMVVGTKLLKKAVNSGRARYVFLAENADPAVTEPLAALCEQNSIQIAWVPSMAELGRACGIEVGAAAAAVVN